MYAGFSPRRLIFLTFVGTAGFTAAFALKARSDASFPLLQFACSPLARFQLREPCVSILSLSNASPLPLHLLRSRFSFSFLFFFFSSSLRHSRENESLRRLFVIRGRISIIIRTVFWWRNCWPLCQGYTRCLKLH